MSRLTRLEWLERVAKQRKAASPGKCWVRIAGSRVSKFDAPRVPDLGRARLELKQGGLKGSHIGQRWYESQSMVQLRGVGEHQGRH
ncbi:MAG: hypothetical protein OXH99_02080 [Bryobacterales bacterium]|nr:hypothetical protein [Bryobacterales bacterium]